MAGPINAIKNGTKFISSKMGQVSEHVGTNLTTAKAASSGLATNAYGGFKNAAGTAFGGLSKDEAKAWNRVKASTRMSMNYARNTNQSTVGAYAAGAASIASNAGKNLGILASGFKARGIAGAKFAGGAAAIGGAGYAATRD